MIGIRHDRYTKQQYISKVCERNIQWTENRNSKKLCTDIIYHGMAEEVRGLEEFKRWVAEDVPHFQI